MSLLIQYADSVLGPKEARQFQNAINQPLDEFHKRVIAPQFYQSNEQLYLALAVDPYLAGRNHRIAKTMRSEPNAWHALTYFTNPLSIPPAPTIINGDEKWVAPMERVIWGHSQVMTYEFDQTDLDFFCQQLAWCRSNTGKPLDCAMGNLFRACSQWIDFEGITVNYSGNKSFHIHIVFGTAQAMTLGIEQNIRDGLNRHWHRLLDTVMDQLKPGVNPDMGMWEPEKFRRIPNGVRKLEKPNILGIPAGEYVPQVTIWEKFRDRARKGAATMFFDPTLFAPRSKPPVSRSAKQLDFLPSDTELDFCRVKMCSIFNDTNLPAFHDFGQHGGTIRAHFSNHAGDAKPASYMDADYRTVNINGSNPMGLTPTTAPKLPKPLGEMIAEWCAEYQQFNTRHRSPIEHDFAMAVVDDTSARTEIIKLLLNTIRREKLAFVCAPEGISKSTGMFDNHHRIEPWLKAGGDIGAVMYAFADYKSAADKAGEFNARQAKNGFVGVVLEGFDRTYQNVCDEISISPMPLRQAIGSGFTNLWSAIAALQPAVISEFQRRHAELWQTVGDATPVFFTVHGVAHNWQLSSRSRMMWARSFWATQGRDDHAAICREETKLSLLIHDEIKVENLLAAYPAEKVDWVKALVASDPNAWCSTSTADQRLASFDAFIVSNAPGSGINFDEVQDINNYSGCEWDQVTTKNSGEYGHLAKGAYAEAVGKEWCIFERWWPVRTASKVIVLTTESVPLNIVRKSFHGWTIFDLDTPKLKLDAVETHAERGVTGKNLAKRCAEWQQRVSNLWIVSNKVAHLSNTMTHAAARGSNKLIGKDILQTMTFVTPCEFEMLEALNAWTGLDCLIRHRHIDEFNQTAGRNLGFRKRGNVRHYLLVNKALFDLLVGAPKARARYEMNVVANRYQRNRAAKLKNPARGQTSRVKLTTLRMRLRIDVAKDQEHWRRAAG